MNSARVFPIAFALGLAGLFPISGEVSGRTFKDSQGREIEADLVAVSGDSVVIKRGGRDFTVKISQFSIDDQAFIKDWIQKNPDAEKFRFSYFVDFDAETASSRKVDYDERLQSRPYVCSASVTNRNPGALKGVKVACQVIVEDFVDTRGNRFRALNSGIKPSSGRIQRIQAVAELEEWKPESRVDIDLPFPTEYYVDRDGGRVDNAVSDKILGVIIRVYRGDQVLDEYKKAEDPGGGIDSVPWSDKEVEEGKAGIEIKEPRS